MLSRVYDLLTSELESKLFRYFPVIYLFFIIFLIFRFIYLTDGIILEDSIALPKKLYTNFALLKLEISL
ncbi:hypothetical protein OTSKATO_1079 [Orientia tsutsugamushi str. Kato PP]|uniref:Uncharacterized protein n=1 Tax=Orientia tsutsugamushi TaxID=784 RepID=A0A2U3QQ00_ORITS|nr:hypothetical protein OTSKATO_1079 [Orientia tsutsugamushi str. Kato PP]SPR03028.1 Uncharacterised protein [Orientia tsutsugamushi]